MATAGRVVALCALVVSPVLTASAALCGGSAAEDEAWLPRYDLRPEARRVVELSGALAEVSGLAVDGRGQLLAHHDESAMIYVVDPATGSTLRAIRVGTVARRGDFEGVAVADGRVFLATSAGVLLEVVEPPEGGTASARRVETGLDKICEVEGLAYEAASAALLLPCKTTWGKQLDDRLLVYAVPLATLVLDDRPRIDVAHADLHAAGLRGAFHPSAIEVHPRSGSLFLVAGRESALVEISPDGRVLAARQLSRSVHPQPEGLAFGPGLELWIADERVGGGGTLTSYPLAADARGGGQ